MKYLLIFISFLVSITLFILFLLFTQSGNNIIKPYIQKELQKKLQKSVSIEAFTLKSDFLDAEIILDTNSILVLNGNFDLLKQSFDFDYNIDAKNLETPYVNINGVLKIAGNAKGFLDNFIINGKGIALNSKINFSSSIEKQNLKGVKLNAKNVKIENILSFFKKPIYSKGMIDINIDITPKENNTFDGNSNITIHYGTTNNALIKRDLGINLSKTVTYRGNIKSIAHGQKINSKANISSNIANIETKNTQYDIIEKVLYSDYVIKIPKLEALNQNIQGNITIDGNIQKTKQDFSFDINTQTFGGNIKAILVDNIVKIDAKKLDITKLTHLLKQKKYSDGKLDLTAEIQEINKNTRYGTISINIPNGTLHVKKILKTKKEDNINYKLMLSGDLKDNNIKIESVLLSEVFNLKLFNSDYNITNSTFDGNYTLNIPDLNNIYFLTKRPLKGNLTIDGNYTIKDNIYLSGYSEFLNATTNFELQNNIFHIKSDDLSILKVTDMLYYPDTFNSFASLEADYNLTNSVGIININALNGRMIKNELTDIILATTNFDITNEIYKDTLFRGVIDKNKIDFSLLMNGLESYFKIPDGYLDFESNTIDSKFDIKIKNKDLQGSIKGDIEKPKVELSGSEYIKQKIEKEIEKNIPKEWQDTAKSILNLFG